MNPERLPAELYDAEGTRAIDRAAIGGGTPGYDLMCAAGAAAWHVIRANWPEHGRLVVYCGAGNNGGDGYVVARLAAAAGWAVEVVTLAPVAKLSGDARVAADAAVNDGLLLRPFESSTPPESGVIVDALLGTGIVREVTGAYRDAVNVINASHLPVFSLDVPSGIGADTGQAWGVAVRADLTLSFIGLNQGLFTGAATEHVGDVLFADLGVADEARGASAATARLLRPQDCRLPRRTNDTHKGSHGRALLVGGGIGMGGAIRLCAEGATRGGAGLVKVATGVENVAPLTAAVPEVLTLGVDGPADLRGAVAEADAIAIGPGLGLDDWGQALWRSVRDSTVRAVVDADALTLWSREPGRRADTIVTPHPGEAATMLGITTPEVQRDRIAAAKEIARRYGAVCVLKGAGSVVADGEEVTICPLGNPGMATGGMGDLLTGLIAALAAQRLSLRTVAEAGVLMHAMAGDRASRTRRSVLARDVAGELAGVALELTR